MAFTDKLMGYEEWRSKGYQVVKGSKAVKRSLGVSLFSVKQVKPIAQPHSDEYYREEDRDFAGFHNYGWGSD